MGGILHEAAPEVQVPKHSIVGTRHLQVEYCTIAPLLLTNRNSTLDCTFVGIIVDYSSSLVSGRSVEDRSKLRLRAEMDPFGRMVRDNPFAWCPRSQ